MTSLIDHLHPLVLNIGLAIHDANWNWQNVCSPFYRLYYITKGHAQIRFPNGIIELKPDHLYFIPAFMQHSYICNAHFEHYYLHIYEDHQYDALILDKWDFPTEITATSIDKALVTRLCEINPNMKLASSNPATYDNTPTLTSNLQKNRQRALCDKIESRGIVYQLLSRFFKYARPKIVTKDKRIEEALDYISRHICEDIDLDKLALETCLSKDHFIRIFKKETGMTPLKFINQKKIERAQLMLVTQPVSVKNIALALAYEDFSYFNRLFKKTTGFTPKDYRLRQR